MCSLILNHPAWLPPPSCVVYRDRSVGLPDFNERGWLPVGSEIGVYDDTPVFSGHPAKLDAIRGRLVTAFAESWSRSALFAEVERLLWLTKTYFSTAIIHVWGDFVTEGIDPLNIGVTLVVTDDDACLLKGEAIWLINKIFNSREDQFTDNDLTVYTELCRQWPDGHYRFFDGRLNLLHVCYMASRPPESAEPRGYAELLVLPEGGNDAAVTRPHSEPA